MKKLLALLTVAGILTFAPANYVFAQEEGEPQAETVQEETPVEEQAPEEEAAPEEEETVSEEAISSTVMEEPAAEKTFTEVIKEKFIEGGPKFMGMVLITLILGLAIVIERIIYLNLATTNTDKLLNNIEDALQSGGIEAAKEVCRNTKGPVASIFYQGLERSHEGIEMVEKSVESYGGIQMGLLEKGVSWISLFIALAPMLGFMGTVIGMIRAFDDIAAAGDISPTVVAGGIKVALLTTVFGLIVAIILQIFYNYIIAKIDSLVNDMENASIGLIDLLVKHELTNKK